MICCNKCFEDPEIQASIISLGHKGKIAQVAKVMMYTFMILKIIVTR